MLAAVEKECILKTLFVQAGNHLGQQNDPLSVGPNDVVDLRAHPLPGELRAAQARLGTRTRDARSSARERAIKPAQKTSTKKGADINTASVPASGELGHCTLMSDVTTCTPYHIDLGVGVAHIADNAAVFHSVELLSGDHILVAYSKNKRCRRQLQTVTFVCFLNME